MKDLQIADKIGKKVEIITPEGTFQGEILTADEHVIVLAEPVDLSLLDKDNVEGRSLPEIKDTIRIIYRNSDIQIKEIEDSERVIKTIGNFARYSIELQVGTYYKSTVEQQDWGKALKHYKKALVEGELTDDLMKIYLQTLIGYVTHIVSRKEDDPDFEEKLDIQKELSNKLKQLEEFRKFLESTPSQAYYSVSDYCLLSILQKIFLTKSEASAENLLHHVYDRWNINLDSIEGLIPSLFGFDDVIITLIFFTFQTDIIRSRYMGDESRDNKLVNFIHACKDWYENLSINLKSNQQTQSIRNLFGKSIKITEENIKKNSAQPASPDLLFSIAFNSIQNDLQKNTVPNNLSDSERINLKRRYDKSMAQCYTLLNNIEWFKLGKQENQSKWHLALNLLDIYIRKLKFKEGDERTLTFQEYAQEISQNLLSHFQDTTGIVRYGNCPRSKLAPMSDYLYEMGLLNEYKDISVFLLDDKKTSSKTPDSRKMICHIRMAKIYLEEDNLEKFINHFRDAKKFRDRLISERTQLNLKGSSNEKIDKAILETESVFKYLAQHAELDLRQAIDFKISLDRLLEETKADILNEDSRNRFSKRFRELIISREEFFSNEILEKYEAANKGEIQRVLTELLPILDDEEWSLTNRISTWGRMSRNAPIFVLDRELLKKERNALKTYIETQFEQLRRQHFDAWDKATDAFIKNTKKDQDGNLICTGSIRELNISKQNAYFGHFNELKALSRHDIIEILTFVFPINPALDQYHRYRVEINKEIYKNFYLARAQKFFRVHMTLLWQIAAKVGIEREPKFHELIRFYCGKKLDPIDKGFAVSRLNLAQYSTYKSTEKGLEERIEYCDDGMEKIDEMIPDKESGKMIPSKEYSDLKEIKAELQKQLNKMRQPNTVADLRKRHFPKHTALLWNKLAFTDLKYLTHGIDSDTDMTVLINRIVEELDDAVESIENHTVKGTLPQLPFSLLQQLYGFIGSPLPHEKTIPQWLPISKNAEIMLNFREMVEKSDNKHPLGKFKAEIHNFRDTVRFKKEEFIEGETDGNPVVKYRGGVTTFIKKHLKEFAVKEKNLADSELNWIDDITFIEKEDSDFFGNPKTLLEILTSIKTEVERTRPLKLKITVESSSDVEEDIFADDYEEKEEEIISFQGKDYEVNWIRISVTEIGTSVTDLNVNKLRSKGGNLFDFAKWCSGYCDYRIKLPLEGGRIGCKTYDILNSDDHVSNDITITEESTPVEGFTHEFTYYKLSEM